MIANCSGDERGKLRGGKAGDQTGREWRRRGWYNRPWTCIIRFEDPGVAEWIARLAEQGCLNDLIGYSQSDRMSFWIELKKAGYQPKNIKVACNTDCSASTLAIVKAVGYLLDIQALKDVDASGYSGNARSILKKAGAKILTAEKYLTSDKYLKRGDILLLVKHHMAINLTDGSMVEKKQSAEEKKPEPAKEEKRVDVKTSMLELRRGSKGKAVKVWQTICGASVDGDFGANTEKKTREYQMRYALKVDGIVGKNTWAKGLEKM